MKAPTYFFAFLALACAHSIAFAEGPADLQPMMAVVDQVVIQDDFAKDCSINKQQWGARQGTRWEVKEGVLRGQPSTKEYQDSHKDHKGFEPRISAPATPAQFIAKFSVRFSGGSETPVVPFVELGHHVCRLHLTAEGTDMVVDHESTRVGEAKDFHYEPGKWYHFLAEMKGDEVVLQVAGGPTFYAKHACFAKPPESGGNGLGIAGPKDGLAEIDNVTIWSVKADAQPTWAAKREALPKFTPVEVAKKAPASPKGKGKGKAKAK